MKYKQCIRCVMDTSDPDIAFDINGICNHCRKIEYAFNRSIYGLPIDHKKKFLTQIVAKIKKAGECKKYDCLIGVSGGVDSAYLACHAVELGLRPLALHLDNGWDSEIAVRNIELILKRLEVELFTYVIDWEEFKDLQLAFLKASTPESEVPTDHAIGSILYQVAKKEGISYILTGANFSTESIMPRAWSQGHWDWKYIRSIHQQFGTTPLKTFPHRNLIQNLSYRFLRNIHSINLLDYFNYDKLEAIKTLEKLGWRSYGGKHHESIYTRFYQSYILPTKFGFDKRKAHLSSLIMTGQIDRKSALKELENPPCNSKQIEEDKEFVLNKFGLTEQEFQEIMDLPSKRFCEYPSYQTTWYLRIFKGLYSILKKLE